MTAERGALGVEEKRAKVYRGMNPAFVRRVWAKRREMARAEPVAPPSPPKKTIGQIIQERAVERERERERQRVEKLKRQMEAGGIQSIIAEVALAHGVTVAEILARGGAAPLVKARHQAIIEVAIRRPAFSLSQIGRCFSRDHTTILHVLKKHGIRGAA